MMNRVALLAMCLPAAIAGCTRYADVDEFLAARGVPPPADTRLVICHGFDCTFRTAITLSDSEWAAASAPLREPASDAAHERIQIGLAVALLEQVVGTKTGTTSDTGGLTYIPAGNPSQLDCIDETVNTTIYLTLFERQGLLRWHRPRRPTSRGFFADGRWYHETAVMIERDTGMEYAVDSWPEDNGKPPLIVPLDDWRWTWSG